MRKLRAPNTPLYRCTIYLPPFSRHVCGVISHTPTTPHQEGAVRFFLTSETPWTRNCLKQRLEVTSLPALHKYLSKHGRFDMAFTYKTEGATKQKLAITQWLTILATSHTITTTTTTVSSLFQSSFPPVSTPFSTFVPVREGGGRRQQWERIDE